MSSLDNKFTAKLTTIAPPIKEYKIPINQDSYILSNNPRTNYGDYNAAQIGNSTTNNAAAMIEFVGLKDIPAKVLNNLIDANISITYSMKLRHDYSLNVYDYNGDEWSELTIYWENAPTKNDKLYTMPLVKGTTSSNIDVTELLQSQIANDSNTLGLYFDSDDQDLNSPLCMYTKEHYNRKYRPILTIRYFDIPGMAMVKYLNGDITVKREVPSAGNKMEINGTVDVGKFSVKADIDCKDDDKLIIPKFTVFDMTATTNDKIFDYKAGYDVISNAKTMDIIQEAFDNDIVTESESNGDMISGTVSVMTAGGNAFINGTVKIPKLFVYTTLFLDDSGTTLFSFPAGTNIADANIIMPYDKTEIVLNDPENEQAEISGEIFVHGFGGYHYINSENFVVSNPVNGIEDITGKVSVAIPRFANYDADNDKWIDFDENDIAAGKNNIITGEIKITPVVRDEITCTGEGKDVLKVPKLFAFSTVLKKKNEDEELEVVYTFPKGEDIDDYSYTDPYDVSERDEAEISCSGIYNEDPELNQQFEVIGKQQSYITGSLLVIYEVPSTDIECEKWDDGTYFKDADFYVLGDYEYREEKVDENDNPNIITCEKSNVDHNNYTDANLYIEAMISIPTYYDNAGHILPEKHDPADVKRIEFSKNTVINGVVGIPHEDPIVTEITGTLAVSRPRFSKYDEDKKEWVDYEDGDVIDEINTYHYENIISCDKSDVDYTHFKDANMYVESRVTKLWMGKVTVKRTYIKDIITGTFTVGKDVDNIDDITCELSDVDHTTFEDANMYVKARVAAEFTLDKDGNITDDPTTVDHTDYVDHNGNKAYIDGTVRPMFRVHEDINGTITVYSRINNGGWIDCDKTVVDGVHVKYTDANMYVIKAVDDYINGDITIRGAILAYINSDNFKVSNKLDYTWINGGTAGLKVAGKASDTWINGNIDIREMISGTIDGTITVEPSGSHSYAYIF